MTMGNLPPRRKCYNTLKQPTKNSMENTQTAVQKTNTGEIEFTPFGGADKIRLTVALIKKFLCKPTKSGAMPTDADAMKFAMLCSARRLNPWEGDAFLVGYDSQQSGPEFSIIVAVQSLYKRAEKCPEFDGMKSGVIVMDKDGKYQERDGDFYFDDDKLLGGWADVFVKGRAWPTRAKIKLSSFWKDNKFWKRDAGGQIVKCAEADALRRTFATIIGGLYIAEEADKRGAIDISVDKVSEMVAKIQEPKPVKRVTEQAVTKPTTTTPAQEDADDADDGDLGPQTRITEPNNDGPQMTQQQAELASMMEESGVSFDDFRDYCKVSHAKLQPETWTGYLDVPESAIVDLRANNNKVAFKIIRAYGQGK
jgi:phage recombination protein Bet